MSEDPITEIERHRRRQDAAYGAAFGLRLLDSARAAQKGKPLYTDRDVALAHAFAMVVASEVPSPPTPPNDRPLHGPWCTCGKCSSPAAAVPEKR